MERSDILDQARAAVTVRASEHGRPENNFATIAAYWNTYLSSRGIIKLTALDVANMMCLFKIGRISTGRGHADNYVDLAGYAACAGELLEGGDNYDSDDG